MLFKIRNYDLVKDREKTYLTVAADVGATTLTVRGVDSNAWADNDWIIVGEIGAGNAEILQINGSVSDGTSLTVDNAGSGGARYAHSVDEPVYRTPYNQIEFNHNSTDTTTGVTVLATNEIQPDDLFTRYEDTANTTGFAFIRFKNSLSGAFSAYSDGIPYTGYTARSLGRMIKMIRRHLNEPDFNYITDDDIKEEINEKQRDISHETLWSFYEDVFSDSTVAYQIEYDIDTDVVLGKVHEVIVRSQPLGKLNSAKFNLLQFDTSATGDPTNALIWNNQIILYPLSTTGANTDTLNGALTASAVSITVDDTSGFDPSGRIIIDSEVISYSSLSSTQFLGCQRGLEETTAATHSDGATVTARDIIYTANREPNELVDTQDETLVPDPLVLVYGVSMELAAGKLGDMGLHDRMKMKYNEGLSRLRAKFGRKFTSQYFKIQNKEEVVSSDTRLINPNQFPQGITD